MTDISTLSTIDDPDEALAAVVALRLMADKLERKTVNKALEQGWTWAQIAEALGITKQAAHKRLAKFTTKNRIKETTNVQATQTSYSRYSYDK